MFASCAINSLVVDVGGTPDLPGPWELSQTAAQLMPWRHSCFCCHRGGTRCACHHPHRCASRERPSLHHTAVASGVNMQNKSDVSPCVNMLRLHDLCRIDTTLQTDSDVPSQMRKQNDQWWKRLTQISAQHDEQSALEALTRPQTSASLR